VPTGDYHEALWRSLPDPLPPFEGDLRLAFLLGHVDPGERVLDLGCGAGDFAAALVKAGALVSAVDVAQEPLRRARAAHPGLEDLRLIDGEGSWQLPDAFFDVVWAGEVIEHVADTAGWLSELRRVLRSGGRLLLSTPHLGRLQLLAAALSEDAFASRFEPRGEDLRFYRPATLTALLGDFGFEDVRVRAAGGRPGARRVLLASAVRSRY
jgi:2-polyprenyl-3-methyl-5-hydroxy-6-metoxy-1,4-benzoquinol methylase